MLVLQDITKVYQTGEFVQHALKGVSLQLRRNEFVAILGPSGSGKTTLLNIIGGLDRYSSGDLQIEGVSTSQFTDRDWDSYRNRTVGFVFQNYHLIAHQSILSNVELALTLAGVGKKERIRRAEEALARVGLLEHKDKKPNQLSGGQMQRVAIARALIHNPEIVLADEPTGALDSKTSEQIMSLLQEIARDRLVIMVTHNAELAERYATRKITLKDGQILSDDRPLIETESPHDDTAAEALTDGKRSNSKTSMPFFTALALSFQNLRTKIGRTLLTSFAGSIGIIGIALILSMSTGIQDYIRNLQEETLASYPIMITQEEDPWANLLTSTLSQEEKEENREDKVFSSAQMEQFFNIVFVEKGRENNLTAFREHLESERVEGADAVKGAEHGEGAEENQANVLSDSLSAIHYQYPLKLHIYVKEAQSAGKRMEAYRDTELRTLFEQPQWMEQDASSMTMGQGGSVWCELFPEKDQTGISEMITSQYTVLAGNWPEEPTDVVLVLDKNREVSDAVFYSLGFISEEEVREIMSSAESGEKADVKNHSLEYDELIGLSFQALLESDFYVENPNGTWRDIRKEEESLAFAIENGTTLRISGIVQQNEDAKAAPISGSLAYTSALTEMMIGKANVAPIVQAQRKPENENRDVLNGLPFVLEEQRQKTPKEKAEAFRSYAQSLSVVEKNALWKEILSTPSVKMLEETKKKFFAEQDTREKKVEFLASAFQLTEAQAGKYVDAYSQEEWEQAIGQVIEKQLEEQLEEQAVGQIYQLKQQARLQAPEADAQQAVAAAFTQQLEEYSEQQLAALYDAHMPAQVSDSSLEENLEKFDAVDKSTPSAISLYAKTFEEKESIDNFIREYNEKAGEEDKIEYTDYAGMIMSGVTTMIDAVTYGLIAFVSISLVVSSIMIGIITYISVLERTKEIGILRSIGASKRDIANVFIAETVIIGAAAGLLGIAISLLLSVPINLLSMRLVEIPRIAVLPWRAAGILVLLSMLLTIAAGLIPAKLAAKKDPVVALRTE